MPLPFDGEISRFFRENAPQVVREAIKSAKKGEMLSDDFPYDKRMDREAYEDALYGLQIELVKLQAWVKNSGAKIAVVFEGRDAAGKGGTIKRFRAFLNPRSAKIVALAKPTDRERGEWYFQRYVQHLPSEGEISFFDRSWYNRGVIEHVFGFCDDDQRALFFKQVNAFEQMVVDSGVHLVKIWLNVGRGEQLRRLLDRESDPLKQWKLSSIDVKGLTKWQAYTDAIAQTFEQSHSTHAPWNVIRTDDKRRARLQAISLVLSQIDYAAKDENALAKFDPKIVIGPEGWRG
jgi:polyphosphate kinase 2